MNICFKKLLIILNLKIYYDYKDGRIKIKSFRDNDSMKNKDKKTIMLPIFLIIMILRWILKKNKLIMKRRI